jgi:hypothetical protein
MKNSRRIGIFIISALFVASCGGGGGGSSSSAKLTATDVSAGLNVNPNGFSFANFTAASSPEEFNADDVVKMFGLSKDVCVGGTTPCTLTAEAAAFARMVNESRASGHCEGFAVTAQDRFATGAQPSTVTLENKGEVTHGLMRTFATQFLKEVTDDTQAWAAKSLKEKVAALQESFTKKEAGYSLGVYSSMGGHAILPYALEWVNEDVVKIKIYDSNWPGKDRYVTVDLKADKWTFAYSGEDPANDPDMWSGGAADMDMTSVASRTSATCPFCSGSSNVEKTILVVRSAALNWSVKTPGGVVRPGETAPGGIAIRPLRSGAGDAVTTYMIAAPSDQKLSFTLPSTTRVSGFTPNAAFQIATDGSSEGTVDVTDASVASTDPNAVLTLADGNLVASSNGTDNSITTTGEALAVELKTESGKSVSVDVTAKTPAVEVRTGDNASGSDYQVLAQTDSNTIEQTNVDASGKETTKTIDGQLDNTTSNQPLPDAIASPKEKPGFLPAAERAFTGAPAAEGGVANNSGATGGAAPPPLRPTASVPG